MIMMVKMKLSQEKLNMINEARKVYGDVVTRPEIIAWCEQNGFQRPRWLLNGKQFRVGRGQYRLPETDGSIAVSSEVVDSSPKEVQEETQKTVKQIVETKAPVQTVSTKVDMIVHQDDVPGRLVPVKDPLYVKFGHFSDILSIVKSKVFYPVYISGLSGNGKTLMTEQICAKAKRDLIRANITEETDEDDLFGGFRLVDHATKWFDGPVIRAMKLGAVLLLDEVDLASTKCMCLQPVLEGKGVFLKKINEFVKPAPGFTVIATANTKGQGNDDGKFVGANVLNEAFLERFSITIEQKYPSIKVESKILEKIFESHGITDPEYVHVLTSFADIVRDGYYKDALDDVISTRRLVHIANAYAIFRDKEKALELCLNRFDENTQVTLKDLYNKISPVPADQTMAAVPEPELSDLFDATEEISF